MSLFVAGADWVAWTQEGYYAASPGGEKLMGWQVNNGLDQLGTFYPAEQFHKAFYRPDVIQRVLAEGSVEKAVRGRRQGERQDDRGRGRGPGAAAGGRPFSPPRRASWTRPRWRSRREAESKDRPVVTMHLLLDGRPCPGAEAKTFPNAKPGDKQEATWKVTLPDGEHHLAALAETDASLGASAEVVVTWQAAAQEPLPTLYVLAVGINAYPGSLKLNWAVDDATGHREGLPGRRRPQALRQGGNEAAAGQGRHQGGHPGRPGLAQGEDDGRRHGGGLLRRPRPPRQEDQPVLHAARRTWTWATWPKTGVTGTQLKEKLKAVPGRVLVLLDACHCGSIGESPADPGSLTDDVQRQLAAPDCGVVIMCAAMAQEEAGEAAAVKHGFFTAALLSGLGGGAPPSKDGLIHLTALNFYVEEEVAELSKDEQHVVVDRPSTVTSFPLVKPPAKAEEK